MHRMLLLITAGIFLLLLLACSGFSDGFCESYPESFMESCVDTCTSNGESQTNCQNHCSNALEEDPIYESTCGE